MTTSSIPFQRDYYRLKAVFEGVWQPTQGEELKADGRVLLTPTEQRSLDRLKPCGPHRETEAALGDLTGRRVGFARDRSSTGTTPWPLVLDLRRGTRDSGRYIWRQRMIPKCGGSSSPRREGRRDDRDLS